MAIGMTTTKKMGIAKTMTMIVPRTLSIVPRRPRRLFGMTTSHTSTSFENLENAIKSQQLMKSLNLFRILPSGVVSKNDIGPLMIRNSIVLCNFLAASRV